MQITVLIASITKKCFEKGFELRFIIKQFALPSKKEKHGVKFKLEFKNNETVRETRWVYKEQCGKDSEE